MKSNHQFCSICEIVEEDGFSAGPQKAYIFYVNHFLYVLQKKSRNKLCLESHDTYALFRMFFSQVYNKKKNQSTLREPGQMMHHLNLL